jgi:type IX secretion system PorP/SprF family membrane protein
MRRALLLLTVFGGFTGFSQDFHLSQYDAASLNANPAMTGVFKGDYRVHAHYRNQWMAVAFKPFVTGVVALDNNRGKWGWGLQLANFRAGIGGYNVFQAMPSFAYKFALDKKRHHFISAGVGVGFFQKSIKASSLTFANQYVKTNGGEFDNSISSGENFAGNGIFKLDVNVGMMYYFAKPTSRVNPFGGFTVFHVNNPKESFLSESNKLPPRLEVLGAARIVINDKIAVTPKVFYQHEKGANELTFSADGQFYIEKYDLFVLGGFTYRNRDAAILMLGGKFNNIVARFSYDINTSSLNNVSNGRGASELSVTYIMKRPDPNPVPTCPKL